jgi:hypothetical protein
MAKLTNRTPSFTDGVLQIYEVFNKAPKGDKPQEELVPKMTLRYAERTVGIKRFWEAKAHDVNIQRLVRCPRVDDVSTQDVAVGVDGKQYRIAQVQYPAETPTMDLSLERIDKVYDIRSNDN